MPSLAEGQESDPPEIRRMISGLITAITPDVGRRIDQESRVQDEDRPKETAPDEPGQAPYGVETGKHKQREDDLDPIEDAVDRIALEIGRPFLAVSRGVPAGGDLRGHPPDGVGPSETSLGTMDVFFQIGQGVMFAMVGDPTDSPALRGATAEGGEYVFKPLGPDGKAPVREQSVIRETNTDTAGQPHEEEADDRGLPGKIGRRKRENRPHM